MPAEPRSLTILCKSSTPNHRDTLTTTFDGVSLYFVADDSVTRSVSVFPTDEEIQALADLLNAYLEHKGEQHAAQPDESN